MVHSRVTEHQVALGLYQVVVALFCSTLAQGDLGVNVDCSPDLSQCQVGFSKTDSVSCAADVGSEDTERGAALYIDRAQVT